eukprot:9237389-Pyramimonas_sp.AAC.1
MEYIKKDRQGKMVGKGKGADQPRVARSQGLRPPRTAVWNAAGSEGDGGATDELGGLGSARARAPRGARERPRRPS